MELFATDPQTTQVVITLGYPEFIAIGVFMVLLALIVTGKFNGFTWTWKKGFTFHAPESEHYYNYRLESLMNEIDREVQEVILIDTLRLKPQFPANVEKTVQLQSTAHMRQLLAVSTLKNHLTNELYEIHTRVYFNNKVSQMLSILADYGFDDDDNKNEKICEDICEKFVLDWLKVVRFHLYPTCERKLVKYAEFRPYFKTRRFKRLLEHCVEKNKEYRKSFDPSFPLTIDMLDSSVILPLSEQTNPNVQSN
jgi:hypothetical protein